MKLRIGIIDKYVAEASYELSELLIDAFNKYDEFVEAIRGGEIRIVPFNLGFQALLEEDSTYDEYEFYYDDEDDKCFFHIKYRNVKDVELSKELLLELIKVNLPAGAKLIANN
ncbi:hypothetical protein I4P50_16105 [Clostridioides difficile]|uniref:hypothetical protein n=1 Tax=Clostridioides difficile TaxID=1496 RepID=UPI000BB1B5C9|nr:hypothetical protein [Clostridioides difficile]EGT3674378.1 hypothetical protein [Clostridioides difficile]EGT4377853.1 hypothetical protein [Clostridioides difficile]EGT5403862.1 hypothetical protein [Clostridioides difficile]EGT5546374.1 hypothetical protein [Clostridioides difficile]EJA6791037.1 hypothetical protein [Clostridioides difficile]